MYQTVFRNALVSFCPEVLRVQLKPLCCAHMFILQCIDSPYVVDGTSEATVEDLSNAVDICSRTWEDNLDKLNNPIADDAVAKKWGKACRKMDFSAESKKFQTYLLEHLATPRTKQSSGESCRNPWPLMIVATLMERVSESRSWNMPMPLARSYLSAIQEINGDKTLMTDEEIVVFDRAKQFRKDMKKD